jgi:hypothetical protein
MAACGRDLKEQDVYISEAELPREMTCESFGLISCCLVQNGTPALHRPPCNQQGKGYSAKQEAACNLQVIVGSNVLDLIRPASSY